MKCSYASLVDLDEGTNLQFYPAETVNGKNIAKIDKQDLAERIECWQNAVLCSVLGANRPYKVIQGFIKCILASYGIRKIIQVCKSVFMVWFDKISDKQIVEKRGVYYFDAKPLLVKGWNPEIDLYTESITSLPI